MLIETVTYSPPAEKLTLERRKRGAEGTDKPETEEENVNTTGIPSEKDSSDTSLGNKTTVPFVPIRVMGLRVEESAKEPKVVDEMIPSVQTDLPFTMRLFGEGLNSDMVIAFTHTPDNYGVECNHLLNGDYKVRCLFTTH